MKGYLKKHKSTLLIALGIWVYLSLIVSATWGADNCDKDYPIKYILYSSLACEIK